MLLLLLLLLQYRAFSVFIGVIRVKTNFL